MVYKEDIYAERGQNMQENFWQRTEENGKRTDLAAEKTEIYREKTAQKGEIDGIKTQTDECGGIKITRVYVLDERGERALAKNRGTYITIESDSLEYNDTEQYRHVCTALKEELGRVCSPDLSKPVLIVGLGNKNITADSLGPKVVEQMLVTRHLFENMPELTDEQTASVCAIAPGVLGITGIETAEIVKGVAQRVKPGLIIVIDALAARRVWRVNTTVQISDTGISPGSGVGNHRKALDKETLGTQVVAIGVPTVVDAATMAYDTLDMTMNAIRSEAKDMPDFMKMLDEMDGEQMYSLIKETTGPSLGGMVMTPKEVDTAMNKISKIIANGINIFLQNGMTIEEIESFTV